MKSRDLNSFFNPKSIAIIGASPNPNKIGGILMNKTSKFKGKIIPINPKYKNICDNKCYKSIKDCNRKIDLVIISIPSKIVNKILKECGERKIKNVIVISAGFSEQGNKKLEDELIKIAKKYSINLLGPNCFGIANPRQNLDTTFSNTSTSKGSTAFISQSGALASYIFDLKNSKLSGFVSLGNASDLNFIDWIKYFIKDKKTKKIVLYIEKLKQGKEFIQICKKSEKPIIVLKAGKTDKGTQATISHTGSLATDYAIYQGAFKQAKVKTISPKFNAIKKKLKKLKAKNILILTNAGGAGAIISDMLTEKGYNIVGEPIDILGDATSKDYSKTLNKIKKRKDFDLLITILTPQKMSEPEETANAIAQFSKNKKVIAFFLGNKSIKKAKKILKKNKVPCITKLLNEKIFN